MPEQASFDITTGCDLQEVDNAVNQANKELTQRYDFRNVVFTLTLERQKDLISLAAPDDMKLAAIFDVLQQKLAKRQVPLDNVKPKEKVVGAHGSVRQDYTLAQGIETEVAKKIVKFVKDAKLKKVQASVQKDQVRVTSPSRDELQNAIALIKREDFGISLNFGNFR